MFTHVSRIPDEKKSQLTLTMYFLKQDWLCQELWCLFLWVPLPQTCFSLLSLTPLSCVCILNYSVNAYCIFSSLSVLLLFPLLYSCMCTETKCISADKFSALNLKFTPQSDDHPSFHFIFFLACFKWLPSTTSVYHVSDSQTLVSMLCDRLNHRITNGALLLLIQALKN